MLIRHILRVSLASILLLAILNSPGASAVDRRPASAAASFAAATDSLVGALLEDIPAVPGLAVAVVVDDQTVLAAGYGFSDLELGLSATAGTGFYIASVTKPYTALAAALLHARGEIDLDSRLAPHLEGSGIDIALVDPAVTMRDLLSHQSGLTNGPITIRVAYTGEHTQDLLWNLLSATTVTQGGAGVFEYGNFGYNLLTLIMDRELGKPWQDVLQDEILTPAGLNNTTARISRLKAAGYPLAAPYFGLHPDGMWRIPLTKTDATMHSAGGLVTTAHDAARWLQLQLNEGRLDGRQVLPSTVIHETHRARVTAQDAGRPPFGTDGCGLGWLVGTYAGETVRHHSGGYPGFRSLMVFLPESRLGVAIFVNEASIGMRLPDALAAWIIDWWLQSDGAQVDLVADLTALRDRFTTGIAADFQKRAERPWQLTLAKDAYLGRYTSPELGTLTVSKDGDYLVASLGLLQAVAEPFKRVDTMRVEFIPNRGEVLEFIVANGRVLAVIYEGVRFSFSGNQPPTKVRTGSN